MRQKKCSLNLNSGLESQSNFGAAKNLINESPLLQEQKKKLFLIRDNGVTTPTLELFYSTLVVPLRYISLLLLVLKTVFVVLCTRMSFRFPAKDGLVFIPSVAVVIAELIKLSVSLIMIFILTANKDIKKFPRALYKELVADKNGNLLILIPGVLFLLQNNLLYFSLKRLPAALYQVLYQLKILITSYFSVIILKRKLSITRWFACILLVFGVVLIPKKPNSTQGSISGTYEFIIGLVAAMFSSFNSGLGAVILEKVIKGSDERLRNGADFQTTVWGRNTILALVGVILGTPLAYFTSRDKIIANGIFQGFSPFVLLVILLNAGTGFVVVAVLKYADGILKCFCNALSIIIVTLCSWLLIGDTKMSMQFAIAAVIVVFAVLIYSLDKAISANYIVEMTRNLPGKFFNKNRSDETHKDGPSLMAEVEPLISKNKV
ncbi:UDP N-acetylglucosamine transporter-like nucleotide sugar transporter [Cryptosporidium ryanae]|uniref:UDP N-acetylglucosamine transporter-like nucleotide sugar transporter n=1 Tax=Cryptosporidium ryanae TaxID=515981 RepID=UPI00351A93BB|nr:UDP N-acetylglucosamine transporter-like nucleotide sugar transporter [Cryptosporidium ryanae]